MRNPINYQGKTRLVLDLVTLHCADSEVIATIAACVRARRNSINGAKYIDLAVNAACAEMHDIHESVDEPDARVYINLPPELPSVEQRKTVLPSITHLQRLTIHYNVLAQKSKYYARHPERAKCLRNLCFINLLCPSKKSGIFRALILKANICYCTPLPIYHISCHMTNMELNYFMRWGRYCLSISAFRTNEYIVAWEKEMRTFPGRRIISFDQKIFTQWPRLYGGQAE